MSFTPTRSSRTTLSPRSQRVSSATCVSGVRTVTIRSNAAVLPLRAALEHLALHVLERLVGQARVGVVREPLRPQIGQRRQTLRRRAAARSSSPPPRRACARSSGSAGTSWRAVVGRARLVVLPLLQQEPERLVLVRLEHAQQDLGLVALPAARHAELELEPLPVGLPDLDGVAAEALLAARPPRAARRWARRSARRRARGPRRPARRPRVANRKSARRTPFPRWRPGARGRRMPRRGARGQAFAATDLPRPPRHDALRPAGRRGHAAVLRRGVRQRGEPHARLRLARRGGGRARARAGRGAGRRRSARGRVHLGRDRGEQPGDPGLGARAAPRARREARPHRDLPHRAPRRARPGRRARARGLPRDPAPRRRRGPASTPSALRAALAEPTALVSIMHANNEIGTLQPIAALAGLWRTRRAPPSTATPRSRPARSRSTRRSSVSTSSRSRAHKLYGPEGDRRAGRAPARAARAARADPARRRARARAAQRHAAGRALRRLRRARPSWRASCATTTPSATRACATGSGSGSPQSCRSWC